MDCRFHRAVACPPLMALLMAAATLAVSASASAQEDFSDLIRDLGRQKQAIRRDMGTSVTSSGRFESNDQRTKFLDYYRVTLQMMQVPGYESELPSDRRTILRELQRFGNNPSRDAFNALVQLLSEELPKLIHNDKQSLPVRYNAILLLGSLNAQEAPPTRITKPVPLPAAFTTLLTIFQDEQLPAVLRVGALIGLHRHASLGIGEKPQRDALRAAMLKAYTQAQPPSKVSQQAHNWIKIRAVEVLGYLGTTGSTPESAEVVAAIMATINDSNADWVLRAESARALQSLDFNAPAGLNTPLIARSLARMVMDSIGDSPDHQQLKHVVHCALVGLTGPEPDPRGGATANLAAVSKVGTPEAKQAMGALANELRELHKKVDETSDLSTVTGEKIAAWLQQNPVENQQLMARN